MVSNDEQIVNIFNGYFNRITDSLSIPPIPVSSSLASSDHLSDIIGRFSTHPCILRIKAKNVSDAGVFEFDLIGEQELANEILTLNSTKKVAGDIPIKILKETVDICTPVLTKCFNCPRKES